MMGDSRSGVHFIRPVVHLSPLVSTLFVRLTPWGYVKGSHNCDFNPLLLFSYLFCPCEDLVRGILDYLYTFLKKYHGKLRILCWDGLRTRKNSPIHREGVNAPKRQFKLQKADWNVSDP